MSTIHPSRVALALAVALAAAAGAQEGAPSPVPGPAGELPAELSAELAAELAAELSGDSAPPLERLVALALERSPRLAALRERAAAARERAGAAGLLDDPTLELRLDNIGFDRWTLGEEEMSRVDVGARQELPAPGKRDARRALAHAEAAVAAAELAAAERELELEVARAAADLYADDAELVLLDEIHELLQLMAETVAARYGAGEGEQRDLLRVQAMISSHDAEREAVAGRRDRAAATLRTALALPAGRELPPVRRLWPVGPPPEELAARAAAEAPAVALAAAAAAVAERRLEIERLELRPDFSVAGGVAYRGDLDPALTLGVGVELPFWRRRRQEPLVRAAEHELAAARAAVREDALRARGEAEALAALFAREQRRLALLAEGLVPQTSVVFDSARAGYLAGRGDLAAVLDDLTLWLQARVERVRVEAERAATAAAIAALLDREPRPGGEGAVP